MAVESEKHSYITFVGALVGLVDGDVEGDLLGLFDGDPEGDLLGDTVWSQKESEIPHQGEKRDLKVRVAEPLCQRASVGLTGFFVGDFVGSIVGEAVGGEQSFRTSQKPSSKFASQQLTNSLNVSAPPGGSFRLVQRSRLSEYHQSLSLQVVGLGVGGAGGGVLHTFSKPHVVTPGMLD